MSPFLSKAPITNPSIFKLVKDLIDSNITDCSFFEYVKLPLLGRIKTITGACMVLVISLTKPKLGVTPPNSKQLETSNLSTPHSSAFIADDSESTQTSIFLISNYPQLISK